MKAKDIIFRFFLVLLVFMAIGAEIKKVYGLMIADDIVIQRSTGRPRTTTTGNGTTAGKKDTKTEIDTTDLPPRKLPDTYYKTVGDQNNISTPTDALKEYCLRNHGCDLADIVARFIEENGYSEARSNYAVSAQEYKPGVAGTVGNQYLLNSDQHGISGFYQAPNDRWYPIIVPTPSYNPKGPGSPRNPDEPYSSPNQPTPPSEMFIIVATLTPTPTPYLGPWPKLKNTSYSSRYRIYSSIPTNPIAYDSDDTTEARFIIGDDGAVVARTISLNGINASAKAGSRDWRLDNYLNMLPPSLSPSDFELYVRGRKEHKEIDSLNEIDGDGIYSMKSTDDLSIDSVPSAFNLYNVVLIAHNNVNINVANSFNPSKSVAIVAPVINFSPQTTDARAIFIANVVNTGETANQGLKINGNLIAQDTFNIQRRWSNLNRPTIFVVFKPEIYLDLLPYLSVASYSWQQQQ